MSFQDLLKQAPTEVERPKPMPEGSYIFNVGSFKFDKSSKKQTQFVQFELTPVQPMPDVDAEALAEVLAVGDKTLADKKMKLDFYLTEDAIFRLDEFLLEHLGLTGSREEMIQEAVGKQVVGFVKQSQSQRDPNSFYANIDSTAAVEE